MLRLSILTPAALFVASLAAIPACSSDSHARLNPPVAPPLTSLDGSAYATGARFELPPASPQDSSGLHNVYALSDQIISGSEPHGEEAFAELQAMGVRTILSVDGKVPDADLAAKYGMSYVHVPIQYKGIANEELTRIVKTFREKEGPIYVHCFHGKHRGPAAAELGRLVVDGISREQALAEMRRCGTADTYEGLYRVVAEGDIPSEDETRAYAWDFPAAHPMEGFRSAMIEISRADDHLKALSKREWAADPAHPDVDAVNEATKLASTFERAHELEELAAKPADFTGWIQDSTRQSAALRDALTAWKAGSGSAEDATKAYKALSATCTACHDVYRND